MGFNNPIVPWSEIQRALSDQGPRRPSRSRRSPEPNPSPTPTPTPGPHAKTDPDQGSRPSPVPEGANGGDSPAWSPQRPAYEPPAQLRRRVSTVPYAELHCHSSFSFLDGASQPEELAEEAARAGLEALALTDHDGFYGVVRFAEAARATDLPTVFGAELSLGPGPGFIDIEARNLPPAEGRQGASDPDGTHLVVLARNPQGYADLSATISLAQMAGVEKGRPDYASVAWTHTHRNNWLVLTGCRKGPVPRALVREGPAAADRELGRLVDVFGRDNVAVELWDHGDPLDTARNDVLARLAVAHGVHLVATNNVHYATPARHRLAAALAAVRARRSLDDMAGWLPPAATAHIRSGDEQAARFGRWPGAVELAAELGRSCAFDLKLVAPKLPPFPCPEGLDEMGHLRQLVEERGPRRYGTRQAPTHPDAWPQIDHELEVIERMGFPGYFLVVWEIVEFCRQNDIFCQGRGSAANSAVCFVLGITNADAVSLGLLFERFLSPERDGPPDIDIDIESGDRREEVIQHVYEMHGRRHAAQVANVISYRARSAVRDMAKALGFSPGQQDAWSRQVDGWGPVRQLSTRDDHEVPASVLALARQVEHLPRHLGIHSGGMVICDRPIVEVCPVEWARKANRSVLQWDKDDCAAVDLVKFDLLGLGMLAALHGCLDLVRDVHGESLTLDTIPSEDGGVYAMLCRADSVGVFQVESRAQMATLPRLRPDNFYDLVVEVALIRPGPIQGGSVHPYIHRRTNPKDITYLDPRLENSLKKTLGVPLFQEQLMQIAMDVAGFTPSEADELRQAMGSKRSVERMNRLRRRFDEGMAANQVAPGVADQIWDKLVAFASYGFPESHAVSFAYLVYASSWLKRYYPAAFCAALLNAQPMGFYSSHSLVQDARRHGVEAHTPDLNLSGAGALLDVTDARWLGRAPEEAPPEEWGRGGPAVRLGLGTVREVGQALAERIVAERDRAGPYADPEDLVRRVEGLTLCQLEALATSGAWSSFGLDRRQALWLAGALAETGPDRLDGVVAGARVPALPLMEPADEARSDLWATGVSPEGHPTRFVRPTLDRLGVVPASGLPGVASGERVVVAGVVTHRQRPATAGGTVFVNLEDETGLINVVVSKGCWAHHRRVLQESPALVVRGRLEAAEGVINVIALQVEPLPVDYSLRSRDFR